MTVHARCCMESIEEAAEDESLARCEELKALGDKLHPEARSILATAWMESSWLRAPAEMRDAHNKRQAMNSEQQATSDERQVTSNE